MKHYHLLQKQRMKLKLLKTIRLKYRMEMVVKTVWKIYKTTLLAQKIKLKLKPNLLNPKSSIIQSIQ